MKYIVKRVPGITRRYGIFDGEKLLISSTFTRFKDAQRAADNIEKFLEEEGLVTTDPEE